MTRLLPVLALLLALLAGSAGAQTTPIQVTTVVTPPFSSKTNEWERHPERIIVTLTNTDPARSYNVRLSGTLEEMGGAISIVTKEDFPVSPITVPAGTTRVLNGSDLKVFSQNAVRITGPEAASIARSGQLPEGTYTLCVQALDHATLMKLSPRPSCAGFPVRTIEAPQLVAPPCDMKVTVTAPQNLLFQWTPPAGASPTTTYTLSLVEIMPPSRNAEEALNTAVPPRLVVRAGQTTTMYRYGAVEPELKPGSRYAWRVQAVDPTGGTSFRNDGKSAVCTFTYGADSCASLAFRSPVNDASVQDNDTLLLRLTRNLRSAVVRSEMWQVTALKRGESASSSVFTDGRTVMTFSLPGSEIANSKNGEFGGQRMMVGRVQRELRLNGGSLTPGARYAMRVAVEFDGENALVGGGSCGMGGQKLWSDTRSFTYITGRAGCAAITNVSPANNSSAGDSSKFQVEYSRDLREANLTGRTYEITELKAGEMPAAVNFDDPSRVVWRLTLGARDDRSGAAGGERMGVGALQDRLMTNGDPRFVQGRRYAWRFVLYHTGKGLFADGEDCHRLDTATSISAPTAFTYGGGCITITAVEPKNDVPVSDSAFAVVRFTPAPLQERNLSRRDYEIVEMRGGETATDALFEEQSRVMRLKLGQRSDLTGTSSGESLRVGALSAKLAETGLTPLADGRRYAWRFKLYYKGDALFPDGSSCGVGEKISTSDVGSFVYSGCASVRIIAPQNDAPASDTSALKTRLSVTMKTEKVRGLNYQFVELRDGESPSAAVFSDGRTVIAFTLGNGIVQESMGATFNGIGVSISRALKEMSLTGDRFAEGKRYAWRMGLDFTGEGALADGSSCGSGVRSIISNAGSFVYNGCASLSLVTPLNDAPVSDTSVLHGRLSVRLKSANINRVGYEFVELRDGETSSAAVFSDGREVMALNVGRDAFEVDDVTSFSNMTNSLSSVQKDLALTGDKLSEGRRYAWRMALEFTGDKVLEDGTSCGTGNRTITSNTGSFIYSGCLALTVDAPLNDAPVGDTSGMTTSLSGSLNRSKMQGAVWEFVELKDGERASVSLFGDGREVMRIPFGPASFLDDPVKGHSIYVSRAQKELSMLGGRLDAGRRYAFRVSINFTGDDALADGSSCGTGPRTITSNVGSFLYNGCTNLTVTAPGNGATVEDSSGLRTELSQGLTLEKMRGAVWEFIELESGEKEGPGLFSDGREVLTVPFGTTSFLNLDPVPGHAITVNRLQRELSMQGTALKPGRRYAFRASINFTGDGALPDGRSCGSGPRTVTSNVSTFVYAGCLRLTVRTPKNGEEQDIAAGDLQASASRPFMVNAVKSRVFEIVELKPGEKTTAGIDWRDGRRRFVVSQPGGDTAREVNVLALAFTKMQRELSMQGDTLTVGARYAWRAFMEVQGDRIFGENLGCGVGTFTVASDTGLFTYGGCLKLTVRSPKSGAGIDMVTGDLLVEPSRPFLINGVQSRTFELVEIAAGENPATVNWRDGRKRYVIPQPGGDSARVVNLIGLRISKMLGELALVGDSLKVGARYAWRLNMAVEGAAIFSGGASCGDGIFLVQSDTGLFTYSGCMALTNISPLNGGNLSMVGDSLESKASRRFMARGVKGRHFEFAELRYGEKPEEIDFRSGGRKLHVIPLAPGDEQSTAQFTTLRMSSRRLLDELALQGETLVPGSRYAWRAVLTVDGETIFDSAKCAAGEYTVASTPTAFVYGGGACVKVEGAYPEDGSNYEQEDDPSFSVTVKDGIRKEGITGGRLKIWKQFDGVSVDSAMRTRPVFDESFTGNDEKKIYVARNTAQMTGLNLTFVNSGTGSKSFRPELGATYVWVFSLNANGRTLMQDTTMTCGDSVLTMAPSSFSYRGGGTNECGDGPPTEAPDITDKTPTPAGGFVGKVIQVGLFRMNVTESSGTGSGLTGKGAIKVATIKAPIKVEFRNVKVNRNLAMYDGQVTAVIEEDGGVIAGLHNGASGRKLDISDSKGAALGRLLSDVKRQATSLVSSKPVGLPLGLDAVVEGKTYTVGIVGMTFEPKHAQLDVALRIETPDLESGQSTAFINFGARDIPMSPNKLGPSTGSMKLYVAGDLTLNLPGGMQFKVVAPKDDELDNDNRGTYVRLKCGKFDGMRLEAATLFPRDWLVPRLADGKADPDSTHRAKATFVAQIKNWSNWIAKAELSPCFIAGEDGFGMEVKEVAYDHSDVANPDGIVFPVGYAKATDNTWRGFYIGRAAISLPASMDASDENGKNLTFSVNNMLIDNTGLTANFAVENIVSKGILAGWGFSIDRIGVELVSSSFRKGYMNGRLKMPVSDDPLAYQCLIQQGTNAQTKQKQLQWQFQIKPEEGKDYTASFWKAKLKLDKSSNITVGTVAGGGKFNARAELTGALSINDSSSKLKLPELRFEQFVAQSNPPKDEKRISCKKWSFTSPAKSMGGFPLSVENVEPEMMGDTVALKFDIKLALAGEQTSIAGAAGLKLRARLNLKAEEWGQKLEFVDIELTKIKVDADLGAVEIHGQIDFYKKDPTFGDGFRGVVNAKFLKSVSVGVTAQFGSKASTKNPGENFRYWYVDAMARFNPGFVIGPAVGIYGFGGGAWYHMAPKNQLDPKLLLQQPENADASKTEATKVANKVGATLSGEEYVPNEETWFGFKASVTIGTVPEPKAANGDVQLSISFTSSGGLERIRFDGSLYFACDIVERKDPSLYAGASILYDNVNKIFHAVFDVKMKFKVLTGEANTVIHFEPKWWQVKIGEPARRAKLEVNLEILKLNINAYLMAGDSLPSMPDPPDEVMSILNGSPKIKERLASSGMIRKTGASGFMFGAGVGVGPVGGSFLCFYGEFGGGAGFDIDLKKYSDLYCAQDPNTPIGFNGGWYAQGQMWAWLKAAIGIKINIFGGERKFDILAIQAALLMRMGGPNPIWMEGYVAGKYSILGGLIKGDMNFFVELGQKCRPVKGDAFSEMELITDIRPNGEDNIPTRVNPQTTFLLPLNETIMMPDLNQPEKILSYRLKASGALARNGEATAMTGMMIPDFDRHRATYRPADYLYPYSQYKFDVTVKAQEFLNGEWRDATYTAAGRTKPIVQTKSATFTTGADVNYIEDVNVSASHPANRQRYFIPSMSTFGVQTNAGYVALYQNQRVLTTYEDDNVYQRLVARFTPRNSSDAKVVEENVFYGEGNGDRRAYLSFSVANLQYGILYDMEILKVSGYKPGKSGFSTLLDTLTVDSSTSRTTAKIGGSMGELDTTLTLEQQRAIRKLGGVYLNPETKNRERQLFKMSFGTSIYFSLDAKMRGMDFKRVDRYDQGQVVDKLVFHYDASEPFDYIDVYGSGENGGLIIFEQSLPYSYEYGTLKSAIFDRINYGPVYNGSRMSASYFNYSTGRAEGWRPGSATSFYYAYILGEYGYDAYGRVRGRASEWLEAPGFEIDKHSLAIGLTDEEIATGQPMKNPPTISYGDWESYPSWPGGTPGNVRFIQNTSNNWRAFTASVFQPLALQAVNDATWGRVNWGAFQTYKANFSQNEINALWGDINRGSPCYWPLLPAGAYWIRAHGPWRGDGLGIEYSNWVWNYYNGASPRRCPRY